MSETKENKFLSPTEILKAYPQIGEKWNAWQLGYLLHLGLIDGFKTSRSSKLNVSDVLSLYEFRFGNSPTP